MTVVMFFAGAWGYLQLLKLSVPPAQPAALPAGGGSLLSDSTLLLALAALVATAVMAGLLAVVPWFSPLASGLPGLLLIAWTALYLVSVRRAVEFIPLRSHAFGAGWEGLLFNGILGAAGAVMIFPLFVPARWRAPRRAADADAAEPVVVDDVAGDRSAVPADDLPRRREDPRRENPRREEPQREEQPLVGTVVGGRPAAEGIPTVDTSRVTGASRALRNTGTFRMATGAQPRAAGSFSGAPDAGPPRRRYYRAADE